MLQRLKQQLTSPQLVPVHQGLHLSRLLPNLTAGLTTGALGVLFDLSFAALIFSGSLSSHLSMGVELVLLSAAATRIIIALTSSIPGIVADLGTVPTAILAWSVGSIAKEIATAPPAEILVTTIAAIALMSLLSGACLLLLGILRAGELVRMMPYPVIGGFVASTGWLLVRGGFKVMTSKPLGIAQLSFLLQAEVLIQWLPGLLLAIYLLILSHRRAHPLVIPVSLVAAVGVFCFLLPMTGTSAAQASAQGWTLSVASAGDLQPLRWSDLLHIHWAAIATQSTCIATVVVTAAISLLMNVSGLELVANQEINLNRELKVAGFANLAIGLTGGILSYHSLSKSVLAHKMGGNSRTATLVGAAVFLAAPLLGSSLLAYFPKAILGGLLLYLGLSLLIEWVYAAWFKFSLADYFVVQLIWMVSGTAGFLQGLTLGWIVAALLSVLTYIRIHAAQSTEWRATSPVGRSAQDQVRSQDDRLYVLELKGFIFFGIANSLVKQIQQRVTNSALQPVKCIILDFCRVPEIDSSAVLSFKRIKQVACHHDIAIVFTHLQPVVAATFWRCNLNLHDSNVQLFSTLEQGLQWYENDVLTLLEP